MASYPTSVFAPAARSNGQTIDASHVNGLQDEVTAIESALEGTITHSVNVSGNSTLAKLSAGASTLATLQVTGNSTIGGGLQLNGSLGVVTNVGIGGNCTVTGTFGVTGISTLGSVAITGDAFCYGGLSLNTPPSTVQLSSGDNNDLALGSSVSYIRIATNSSGSTLTGIQSAAGFARMIVFTNVGPSAALGLKTGSGSVSSNQFSMGNDTSIIVGRGGILAYDVSAQKWFLVGRS